MLRRQARAMPPSESGTRGGGSLPTMSVDAGAGLSASFSGDTLSIFLTRPAPIWAIITGQASATNRYAWTQINDADITGTFSANLSTYFAASGTSDEAGRCAYEINGSKSVPTGAKVLMRPGGDGSYWVFSYLGTAELPAAIIPSTATVNGDPATTLSQYSIENPTTGTPVNQYVVANDATGAGVPGIVQYQLPSGTGSSAGLTSTLTASLHTLSYTLDGETGGVTVSSNGTNIVYTYTNAIITGATITGGPTWQLIGTKTHADLTAASGTEILTYATLAAKTAILGLFIRTKTVGSGGGVASLVLTVTISAAPVGANGNGLSADDIAGRWYPDDMTTLRQVPSWTATTAVGVQFFADVNVVDLTGGEWELYGLLTTVP